MYFLKELKVFIYFLESWGKFLKGLRINSSGYEGG